MEPAAIQRKVGQEDQRWWLHEQPRCEKVASSYHRNRSLQDRRRVNVLQFRDDLREQATIGFVYDFVGFSLSLSLFLTLSHESTETFHKNPQVFIELIDTEGDEDTMSSCLIALMHKETKAGNSSINEIENK